MKKEKERQQLYTDMYFDEGHWWLKIWQTFIAILGWLCVFVPIIITVTSFWADYNPKIPHLWSYSEGIFEVKFAMSSLFAVSMTIIQNRRRDRLAEQWPTYNPINQRRRETELEKFMDERFGDKEFRENTRYYEVKPEQNLDTDQIKEIYRKSNLDDIG